MNESNNAVTFAKNLRRYMKLTGKGNKEVAEYAGVTPSTVSYWLSGKKYPRVEKMSALAEFFSVQMSDLMEEKPKKKVDPQTVEARIISVGVDKMKPEDREKALNMMRVMFAEIYEANDWSDDDEA